ncbi:MAG: hypothetical protein ABSG90_11550 [Dehalococcoidia bacterium]|jgi:hypothetical protein
MVYGTYDRHVVDGSNSDIGQGGAAAINLSSQALGVFTLSTKTAREPMTVDRLGFMPVTVFALTVPGALGLYRYPHGLTCVDLPTALKLCNDLSANMIAHAADAVIHLLPDTTYFSATLTPSTPVVGLTDMMVQINLLITAFTAHAATDEAKGTPVFHLVTDSAGASAQALTSTTPVTTLATSITMLNDMLTRYNLHDMDVVAHHVGHLHQSYKVLLASIALVTLDAVGFDYVSDVDNLPVEAVYPYQGLAIRGVADMVPGDQVAIELITKPTGTGTLQPFFGWHCRAESEADMPFVVNRTPVKTAVTGTNRLAVVGGD